MGNSADQDVSEPVNIRLSRKLLDDLDAEAARLTKSHPGMTYTRADVIRILLTLGVQRKLAGRMAT